MKKVLVAGGGIMGLITAWYLTEAGHDVTVIDKDNFLNNCSLGNAGLIVPSHFVPLAAPGVVRQGIKWIFNPFSPFSMNFRLDIDLLKWSLRFWSSSNATNVAKSASVLLNFNLLSKELYRDLSYVVPDINLQEKGLLMLCRSVKKLEEEFEIAERAIELGLEIEKINREALKRFGSGNFIDAEGGVLYKSDAQLSPDRMMQVLTGLLKERQVSLLSHTRLIDFIKGKNEISGVITNNGSLEFDEIVIATGAFSQHIFKKLNIRAKIQAGKGYSFKYKGSSLLNTPAILVDGRVSLTPYDGFTRFAGAMEIGGKQSIIKQRRVKGIVNSIRNYFPETDLQMPGIEEIWSGLRPCSSDGLPFIGRVGKYRNVIIATGHSMMGVSMAPATGKVVEELISGKKLSFDIHSFSPDR